MKKLILFCLVAASLVACKPSPKNTENAEELTSAAQIVEIEADTHNAQNSLDYYGVYEGITPCADCEGIKVSVVLNKDETYTLKQVYIKNGKELNPTEFSGKFTWNDKGAMITLEGRGDFPSRFLVSEGALIIVDAEGKQIDSNLAEHYRLKQVEVY